MCLLSHSNLLIYLVIKYLLHTNYMEANIPDNVSNASNPLSLTLYDKTYIVLTVCQVLF